MKAADEIERLDAGWAEANLEVLRLSLEAESLRARVGELEEATNIAIEINNSLTSELDALNAGQGKPVAYQFQDHDDRWCDFSGPEHYEATVADGAWPIRPLFTQAPTIPTQGEPVAVVATDQTTAHNQAYIDGRVLAWDREAGKTYIQPFKELPVGTKLFTQASTIQEGWQLVPIEPTEEMIKAGNVGQGFSREALRKAIAAAPKQEPSK